MMHKSCIFVGIMIKMQWMERAQAMLFFVYMTISFIYLAFAVCFKFQFNFVFKFHKELCSNSFISFCYKNNKKMVRKSNGEIQIMNRIVS